ncbi:MAG: hypothetical protein HUN04_02240 [Desulfobacter sp.]|nr:MAG: hypothetical protein HUN04_02240 [Desulfobacter sp.]
MRKAMDRRKGIDRRNGYNPAVMNEIGYERRSGERRSLKERRVDWVAVGGGVSVWAGPKHKTVVEL